MVDEGVFEVYVALFYPYFDRSAGFDVRLRGSPVMNLSSVNRALHYLGRFSSIVRNLHVSLVLIIFSMN